MTPQDTLDAFNLGLVRFAVELANLPDVNTLTVGARARLLDAMRRAAASMEPHMPCDTDTLIKVQRISMELLEQVSQNTPIAVTFKGQFTLNDLILVYHGPPCEMFRFSLLRATSNSLFDRVRRCPECQHFFLRIGRRIYCRPECTNRATWRNYPEEKKYKARAKWNAKQGWSAPQKRETR